MHFDVSVGTVRVPFVILSVADSLPVASQAAGGICEFVLGKIAVVLDEPSRPIPPAIDSCAPRSGRLDLLGLVMIQLRGLVRIAILYARVYRIDWPKRAARLLLATPAGGYFITRCA